MEKVRAFDQKIREIYNDECTGCEMVAVIFGVLANLMVMIPFYGNEKLDRVVFVGIIYLLGYSIMYYLRPYLVIEGESIYKKIQYMPVTKKEIVRTRIGYLNQRWKILFAIGFVLHQIYPLCSGSFGVRSILEVFVVYLIVWIWGFLQIHFTKR